MREICDECGNALDHIENRHNPSCSRQRGAATVNLDIPPEYWKQETWTVNMDLRWAYGSDDNEPVLQRASVSNLGNIRWDDIPSVRLPTPPHREGTE